MPFLTLATSLTHPLLQEKMQQMFLGVQYALHFECFCFVLFYFGFGQLLESDQILKISCFTGAW